MIDAFGGVDRDALGGGGCGAFGSDGLYGSNGLRGAAGDLDLDLRSVCFRPTISFVLPPTIRMSSFVRVATGVVGVGAPVPENFSCAWRTRDETARDEQPRFCRIMFSLS